ncbi:Uracil phosphoribosyltransferase like protein [Lucilia cuprina]|nr:Uracil phosphoribosyltransferase like protein [Lucilia cuprina]
MCASASLDNNNGSSSHSNSESIELNEDNADENIPIPAITSPEEILEHYGPNFKLLQCNAQVGELLTIIRDKYKRHLMTCQFCKVLNNLVVIGYSILKLELAGYGSLLVLIYLNTSRSDFKFYADRLIRLVIEESLNQLPYSDCSVETPTGAIYDGLKYQSGNCGVSIIRSGEAMEQGLRDCCRSIRIGKILVESDSDTHVARVVYARFPDDIARRQILLMYPIMSTGNTVLQAVNVLKEHGVPESSIILSNLFCTPMAAKCVVSAFPRLKILTSELHPVAPNHFGQKYFGTD